MRYLQVTQAITDAVWFIKPEKLQQMLRVIEARDARVDVDQSAIELIKQQREEQLARQQAGEIRVLSIFGTITQKGFMGMSSMGTSIEEFDQLYTAAINDPNVKEIILSVDSVGGSVYGVDEMAKKIFQTRDAKPVTASVAPEAFSAAYYLASAASKIYVQPTGMVGSVGVVATHVDESKVLEAEGIKVTYITAGKYKVEGNSTEPLSDEAHSQIQLIVDNYYDMFISALARNFGLTTKKIESDFGQGRVFNAKAAAERGMVHGIKTFDEVVQMSAKRVAQKSRRFGPTKTQQRRAALGLD